MFTNAHYGSSPSHYNRDAHLIAALQQGEDGRPRKRRRSEGATSIPEVDDEEAENERSYGEDDDDDTETTVTSPVARRLSVVSRQSQNIFKTAFSPTEATPLLRPTPLTTPAKAWRLEAKLLAKYSAPILGTHILEFSLMVSTVVSTGHLSTNSLAAASLASMTTNVTALSIIQGFCTALDTLASQAATSDNPELTGLHAQRTCIILAAIMPFQIAIAWASEPILLALGQDPEVSRLACHYLRMLSVGYPGYAGFEVFRRWLQAQGLMTPPALAIAIVAPLNLLMQYLFVWSPSIGFGFIGAPLATAISFTLMFAITALYCYLYAPRRCWGGWSRAAFSNFGPNLKLGFAGVLAVSSEWWAFEALGLGASYFGPTVLAAQSVLLTTASSTYQVPYALSVAAAVRIGNLLGMDQGHIARTTAKVTVITGLIVGLVNSSLLVLFRGPFARLFTSDEEVIALVARVMPLIALFQIADCSCGAASGILRGTGRSPVGALINLASYYVVGLPLAFGLAFGAHLGLEGLWIGITVALGVGAIITLIFVSRLDYEGEAAKAKERMA